MERRKFFSSLLGGAAAGTAASTLGGNNLPPAQVTTSGDVEVFGVIRFPSSGPQILNDAGHKPHGLINAFINSNGWLEVTHTNLVRVGVSVVNPDETLVARGIMVGNSQALDAARIRFYETKGNGTALNLNNSSHYKKIAVTNANIWFWSRGNV